MNQIKRIGIALGIFTLAFAIGCGQVVTQIKGVVADDLTRTTELATTYGKPEVAQCAVFLNTVLKSQDSTEAKIDALLAEKTDGLISATFKAYLLAELVKSLNDPAFQAQLQKDFDTNCKAVAGQLFINLVRDARKTAAKSKGIGL